jgi:hypothetical protein
MQAVSSQVSPFPLPNVLRFPYYIVKSKGKGNVKSANLKLNSVSVVIVAAKLKLNIVSVVIVAANLTIHSVGIVIVTANLTLYNVR